MKDNKIVLPPDAKGGVSITPPKGCEVDKVEVVDGVLTVTFKLQERKLPKTWEEFCEMNPIKDGECYIGLSSNIVEIDEPLDKRRPEEDCNVLPDYATAEAVLALCKLIQLRNCYNGDWVPDWKNGRETKFMIIIYDGGLDVDCANNLPSSLLYFKTKELRNEFLRNFRPLIEKLKPLYGIKEGGVE